MTADPREIVERVMQASAAIQDLGPVLDVAAPGFVRMTLDVRPSMLNGQRICYGGTIFGFGDTAAALAALTHGRAVTQAASIDFIDVAREGETLVAEAREALDRGRTRIIDVRITAGDGRVVAVLRTRFRSVPDAAGQPADNQEK